MTARVASLRGSDVRFWVNRVILDAGRTLLVNPGNRTFAALPATSESCQLTDTPQPDKLKLNGCLRAILVPERRFRRREGGTR
jgi:hypothetical protein